MAPETTNTPEQTIRDQEREIQRLKILLDISEAMNAELDLDSLLHIIMDKSRQVLDAERCSVFLLDKEKNELWSKAAHGIEGNEIRLPANMGLVGHVVMTGKTLNVDDAYEDPRFDRDIDKKTGYRTKTILSIPLKNRRGEVIGVFQILNKLEGVFNNSDEELLTAISLHAAMAIENAQLYEEQKRIFTSFVETLAATIDAQDTQTTGHSYRVTHYCQALARIMDMAPKEREILRFATLLHDFGKLGVREDVLFKDNRLDNTEFNQVRNCLIAFQKMLQAINLPPEFHSLTPVVDQEHLPIGQTDPEASIPDTSLIHSQIMVVADVFDTLTAQLPGSGRVGLDGVIAYLKQKAGSHFDKGALQALFKLKLDIILSILLFNSGITLSFSDKRLFSNYTLNQYYKLFKGDPHTKEETKLLERFNTYYQHKAGTRAVPRDYRFKR